jgi:membrane protein DedA with SNARE-associated domain
MIAQAFLASTAIILLSFVSEDAATISSAFSVFGGPVSWPLGFAACFAGIWLGDLGLYSLARCLGKPILQSRWVARFADPATIERCREKFNQRGSLALLASRFAPGTRLPTYLAAGLLSMPVARFAIVTAIAALLWIGCIFAIAKLLGSQTLIWFSFFQGKIAPIVFTTLFLAGAVLAFKKSGYALAFWSAALLRRFHSPLANETSEIHSSARSFLRLCLKAPEHWRTPKRRAPILIRRLTRWEFWPAWLFYIPVGVYYAWLAIRHRSLTVPTSANPGIATGGFIGESKLEILDQLRQTSPELTAEAFPIDGRTTSDRLLCLSRICREQKISLPFILKPDVGQRGNGVRVVRSMRTALDYLQSVDAPVIVQRYVPGPREAGVFYYRFPGESQGHIFAITEKIFPTIIGDGVHTIEELIRADDRAALMARTYLWRFASRRAEVLASGEVIKLVETGNHAQGCIFRDGMHLHTEELERMIHQISQRLSGFFVGRYDIRYENEEDFKRGRNFQIIEVNGATSEATSIYDARKSLLSAYRTLFRQWKLVFAIGAANRANGYAPSRVTALWRNWRQYSAAALSYPLAD